MPVRIQHTDRRDDISLDGFSEYVREVGTVSATQYQNCTRERRTMQCHLSHGSIRRAAGALAAWILTPGWTAILCKKSLVRSFISTF